MMNVDNDTRSSKLQNSNSSKNESSKSHDSLIAKLIASVTLGMAAGAGATYAAEHYKENEESSAKNQNLSQGNMNEPQPTNHTIEKQQTTSPSVNETNRIAKLEENERIREQHEKERLQHDQERQQREQERQQREQERQQHEQERQQQEQKRQEQYPTEPKEKEDFFKAHDVKIVNIEETKLPNGQTAHIYSGTVDGHAAAFMDDGNGHIVGAVVDSNDNATFEDDKIIDMEEYNMTSQQLSEHIVKQEAPADIQVVSVANDVEYEGQTVNLAVVSINDELAMLVDTNQNGEANLLIADENHNGNIENGERHDVSQSHIAMPTRDDISGVLAVNDDANDYNNDADTGLYEG